MSTLSDLFSRIPAPSPDVAAILLLTWTATSKLKSRTGSLARRGYLACLPLGRTEDDDVVIRLGPGGTIIDSPSGVAWGSWVDGLTIAPRLGHFVAGRLAQLGGQTLPPRGNPRLLDSLREFSQRLGGAASTEAVLRAARRAPASPAAVRRGILWAALGRYDPLFRVLGGAWTHEKDDAAAWFGQLRGAIRNHPIAVRIRLGYHTRFKTGVDVSADAWHVVLGDQVFDRSYSGVARGAVTGSVRFNALSYAVEFLRGHKRADARFRSALWTAAQEAIDDDSYDGETHLVAATRLASRDPRLAFVQMTNATMFGAGKRSGVSRKARAAALTLAARQRWNELMPILEASRD